MRTDVAAGPWAGPAPRPAAGPIVAVTAGVVIGVVQVVFAASLAALVFAGPLARHLSAGIGLLLLSLAIVTLLVALLSPFRGMIALPQDTVGAICAVMAAAIASRVGAAGAATLPTVIVAVSLAAVLLGAAMLALGVLRLGNLVRFIPYPVVGGFLAGTGWLLVRGGIGVMTDTSVSMRDMPELLAPAALAHWLPGAAFGALVVLLLRRRPHVLTVPAAVAGAIAVFYAVLLLTATPVAEARAEGWLVQSFEGESFWRPQLVAALPDADWGVVASRLVDVVTLIVIATVALLLNCSGVELSVGRDVDLNAELRAAGVANLAVGLAGGVGGYQALSLSVLALRMRAAGRLVGVTAAGVAAAALMVGPSAIAFFPKPVLGGLLVMLGLGFLVEWVVEAWSRLPRADYFVVLFILVVIAAAGFLPGVAVGTVAAIVLFVANYGRIPPVKHRLSGATYRSKVERPARERWNLREEGGGILVFVLQGFLFFGTANRLLEEVRAWILENPAGRKRFLIFDFRVVRGIDSSAAMSFERIGQLATSHGVTVVLTDVAPAMRRLLERRRITEGGGIRFESDVDHGMEWCEARILEGESTGKGPSIDPLGGARAHAMAMEPLMAYLEPMDVGAGEYLIRQDEAPDGLYFVESGSLTVRLELEDGRWRRLRRLLPGTVVGEVGMYLGVTRASSVVAEEPARVYRMSAAKLAEMDRRDPELAARFHRFVATLTAERLADVTQTVEDLLR